MQKTIGISTDVFAAIWANRSEGEDSEDAILRRLLDCSRKPNPIKQKRKSSWDEIGFVDKRNGIKFPRGFTIFRRYKGRDYEAAALDNTWLRSDTNERFGSLNQLNESIVDGTQSVWDKGGWKYRTEEGEIKPISNIRRLIQLGHLSNMAL